jgi:hypothetical protein
MNIDTTNARVDAASGVIADLMENTPSSHEIECSSVSPSNRNRRRHNETLAARWRSYTHDPIYSYAIGLTRGSGNEESFSAADPPIAAA